MKVLPISIDLIDPNPANARVHFDADALAELAKSLRSGQRVPCIVYPAGKRYCLLDGERRLRAARLAGLAQLECVLLDGVPTRGELLLVQAGIDGHKAHLRPAERAKLYADLLEENGLTPAQLHEREGIPPSTTTKYLSYFKCVPEVQAALAEDRIGISDCYVMAPLAREEQLRVLGLKLGGASRDALARAAREQRSGGPPPVRRSRVKLVLPDDFEVAVSGPPMSLDDLVDVLGKAQDAARRGKRDGWDVKSLASVLRDKHRREGA